ncbi:MAG: hypothetical protein RR623_08285 [Bacilli bacterium]
MPIKTGDKILLKSYMNYPQNPEKSQEVGFGSNSQGEFLIMQTLDITRSKRGIRKGFFYVQIHTTLKLKPGDYVTVKKFNYVQNKGKVPTIDIDIEETDPLQVLQEESNPNNEEEAEYGY